MSTHTPDAPSASPLAVAHSVPNTEHGSPEIREALMKYRPVNVLPADWNRVKDFCRRAVADYGPANSRSATETLSTVTLFVLWATSEEYAPLEREALFHPALMGRYLRGRVTDKRSGAYRTLHSRLFRVANAIAKASHPRKQRATNAVPVHEYTARELAELESWAATQNTPLRRRHAYTVLALMGGAGLAMTETLNIRGRDIQREAGGYCVNIVGTRPRVIPIHSDWAGYLHDPLKHIDADQYVLFGGKTPDSRATSLRYLYRGPHPAPNPQWLRDTWTLALLRAVPLNIVMQASGTADVARFRRYLNDTRLDFADWREAVREPAAYRAAVNRDVSVEPGKNQSSATDESGHVVAAASSAHIEVLERDSAATPAAQGTRSLTPAGRAHQPVDLIDSAAPSAQPSVLCAANASHVEADSAPKATAAASRNAPPPGRSRYLPAAPKDLIQQVDERESAPVKTEFAALREALLAEARQSRRSEKQ